MSTLVELPPEEFNLNAFDNFNPKLTNFTIENARALMWFSQLAYETGRPETIRFVASASWGFGSVSPFARRQVGIPTNFETCGIIGERLNAVVLAFAGTDPAVWENLATDFDIEINEGSNTHHGFQAALEGVLPEVDQAILASQQGGKPLFIAGHSLGAALAALAARHAVDVRGVVPGAVYVFGMPRVGGEQFRADYQAKLGSITYRLVHGLDIVARIPRSGSNYRHVGCLLQCESGKKFNLMQLSNIGLDEPDLGLAQSIVGGINGLLSGNLSAPPGPGPFGPLFRVLPQPIRDHLQDRYLTALS
jgi:triacylglycerol lipase